MANLQIKGIDDGLYAQIKSLAASEKRSVSQQVLFLIKEYLSKKKHIGALKSPAEILLALSGSWGDDRKPEDIVKEIKRARKDSKKLKEVF